MWPRRPPIESCYPDFPEEYREYLPTHWSETQKRDLGGCFCPICTEDLHQLLPSHSELKDIGQITKGRTRYSSRQLLEVFTNHIEKVNRGIETPNELGPKAVADLDTIKSELSSFVSHMEQGSPAAVGPLPSLDRLAAATNSLFFGGCLSSFVYVWESAENAKAHIGSACLGYCSSGRRPPKIVLVTELLSGPGSFAVGTTPQQRVMRMLAVLLHEQIHAYLSAIFLCNGTCRGTNSQRQLCNFLCTTSGTLFREATYRGSRVSCSFSGGHGPAFAIIGRALKGISNKLAKIWYPSAGSIDFTIPFGGVCHCSNKRTENCLYHCFPSQQEQLANIAIRRASDLTQIDKHLGGTWKWKLATFAELVLLMLLLALLCALTVVLFVLELNMYMAVLRPGSTIAERIGLYRLALAWLFCALLTWNFHKRTDIDIDTWINVRLSSFFLLEKLNARFNDLATQLEHYYYR